MDDGLVASIILGICFWGFIGIIKSISEYRLTNKLIERSNPELEPGSFKLPDNSNNISNLKWGIIIFLGGIGLVLIHYLKLSSESPLPYGIESISIALGFILYFFIEKYSGTGSKK
ncbi:MAG TPA: hypothetical protein VJ963_13165 [Bacteroidales bacterium]|nr:hypothetical protein [Bacteroidales bacterium]